MHANHFDIHIFRFSFPSIFVVYLTCDLIVAGMSDSPFKYSPLKHLFVFTEIFIIITYFDRPGLYCTSPNLLESLVFVAPFCVITGNNS